MKAPAERMVADEHSERKHGYTKLIKKARYDFEENKSIKPIRSGGMTMSGT
jgi:hypothetical protein